MSTSEKCYLSEMGFQNSAARLLPRDYSHRKLPSNMYQDSRCPEAKQVLNINKLFTQFLHSELPYHLGRAFYKCREPLTSQVLSQQPKNNSGRSSQRWATRLAAVTHFCIVHGFSVHSQVQLQENIFSTIS